MSIEVAARPHTHGAGEVPPKTKSQLLRSFDPAEFPALNGREEEWRFTPIKRLAGLDDAETAPAKAAVAYTARALPEGVTVEAVGKDDRRIGSILTPFDRPSAVAWAKTDKALLISVAPESEIAEPVWIDVTGGGLDGASWAHTYIEVGHHADVTLIMRHTGAARLGDNIEIAVGDSARLRLVSVAEWDRESVQVEHQKARLGSDARLDHIAVSLGGDLVRQYLSVDYAGRGGSVDAFGLYFADTGQHLEHRQLVDHSVPDCRSYVNYRGALQGETAHTVGSATSSSRTRPPAPTPTRSTGTWSCRTGPAPTRCRTSRSRPARSSAPATPRPPAASTRNNCSTCNLVVSLKMRRAAWSSRASSTRSCRRSRPSGFARSSPRPSWPGSTPDRSTAPRTSPGRGGFGRMSEDFLRVCALDDLPDAEAVAADIHGTSIALVRHGEEVFAVYDECSHAAVALSEGEVEDCTLECWLHGSMFDLRTGKPTGPPATVPVATYPVEIRDGDVYLSLKPKTTELEDQEPP
ncbi:hypothetical protein GCM10029992_40850 [Glycomyces albus]